MKRQILAALAACSIVLLVIVLIALFLHEQLARYHDAFRALAYVGATFGALSVIFAVISYFATEKDRAYNRSLERAKLTIDLMSQFYEPEWLEEIRRSLRDGTPFTREPIEGSEDEFSLRRDEVWVMNFFETISILVDEGVLSPELVERMLGSPILEVRTNPSTRGLIEERFSYEGYKQLVETIDIVRKQRLAWVSG